MKKLAIIHYLPLEFYPPVINYLKYLDTNGHKLDVRVMTTRNNKGRSEFKTDKFKILRFPLPRQSDNIITRVLKYMIFNIGAFLKLLWLRPNVILYYESYSAMPVYYYGRYVNRNAALFIHSHEYFSPEWYSQGMRLVKFNHKREQTFLYLKAKWISHTNKKRLELFLKDNPKIQQSVLYELPNYPARSWFKNRDNQPEYPIRLVFVGSVSISSCYIKEICNFVTNKNGSVLLDIFSYNADEITREFLMGLDSPNICFFKDGVEYESMPSLLVKYDVGLILYKGNSLNYKYNAPNKLFEYLVCGLDVWYPDDLLGMDQFIGTDHYPKVAKLDFKNLEHIEIENLISREGLKYSPARYNYEDLYDFLTKKIIEQS